MLQQGVAGGENHDVLAPSHSACQHECGSLSQKATEHTSLHLCPRTILQLVCAITNARLCVIVWCGVLGQEYTVSPKPPTRAINPATMGRGRRAGGRFGTDGSQR